MNQLVSGSFKDRLDLASLLRQTRRQMPSDDLRRLSTKESLARFTQLVHESNIRQSNQSPIAVHMRLYMIRVRTKR